MGDTRARLRRLLAERSVLTGDFLLSSGRRSSVYLDTRLTTTTALGMTLIGPAFLELFRDRGWWKPDRVLGPTLGADPILGAISYASALAGDPVDHLIVRKQAKGHGTGKRLEGGVSGARRVIVVEDVWTTGASTRDAVEAARAEGLEVIGAAALVDREQGAAETLSELPRASLYTLRDLLAERGLALDP